MWNMVFKSGNFGKQIRKTLKFLNVVLEKDEGQLDHLKNEIFHKV